MRPSGLKAAVERVHQTRPGVDVGYVAAGADDSYQVTVAGQASANVHQLMGFGVQPGDPVLRLRHDAVQDPFVLELSPYHSGTNSPPVINL